MTDNREVVKRGLAQLPSHGLERIVAWKGPMLLDGMVRHHGKG